MNSNIEIRCRSHVLYPLYLNYAQRSLLGGTKGQLIMQELLSQNPDLYKVVMSDAKVQTDELLKTIPEKERAIALSALVSKNLLNMMSLVKENK